MTFELGILCSSLWFLRPRWCQYFYSVKKAPETTLPFCLANSSWDFLGTLLLQCWGGRHANLSPWKKHCPRLCIFRGRPNFSKSQQQRQGDRKIQFELELGHASIYFLLMGLRLCNCWFWFLKNQENSANFIGQHFVLITEPRETQWRHNTGNSWKTWHWAV